MRVLSIFIVFIVVMPLVSKADSDFSCVEANKKLDLGHEQEAFKIWSKLAYDSTIKEEVRATGECLKTTKRASSDREVALLLIRLTENGSIHANEQLGILYFHGTGVKKDIGLAKQHLIRAEKLGSNRARQVLTLMESRP